MSFYNARVISNPLWHLFTRCQHVMLLIKCCLVSPQVILVQVNPGEAFTIRREDGQFQCITGKKDVLCVYIDAPCNPRFKCISPNNPHIKDKWFTTFEI